MAKPDNLPPVILAAKAGHNAEPHNHNDVGSFVLAVGETVLLCDPGAGRYSRDYFGPRRYENVFASSFGHSVPRIGGKGQAPGGEFQGTIERVAENQYKSDMTKAYDIPVLRQLTRILTLEESGLVRLEDRFVLAGTGTTVDEVFVTWYDVQAEGPRACIQTPAGYLEIVAEDSKCSFHVETLAEESAANNKHKSLKRIVFTVPSVTEYDARFAIQYYPAKPQSEAR